MQRELQWEIFYLFLFKAEVSDKLSVHIYLNSYSFLFNIILCKQIFECSKSCFSSKYEFDPQIVFALFAQTVPDVDESLPGVYCDDYGGGYCNEHCDKLDSGCCMDKDGLEKDSEGNSN